MWIEFPSLLPISTFLLFLSPSEHSTQYSAEIIFCWMRFGHKSRADLLRAPHSLFPGLLSTWQFKPLITLTRNPFGAEQSRPARRAAPPGTWAVLKVCWAPKTGHCHRDQGCPVLPGMIKVSLIPLSSPCLCLQKVTSLSPVPHPVIYFPPREAGKRHCILLPR